MTYNIIFEWIAGAQNKAVNCLSRLVKLPNNNNATIKMLTATISNGPAFNTRSKTSHQCQTTMNAEPSNTYPYRETVKPDFTTVKATHDVTPKPLTDDRHKALLQMQKMDPFCKCISKCLSNGVAPKHEANLFTHIKGLLYKHIMDANQKFMVLIIPKAWNYMVLVEPHDKLRHQGVTGTYCLIKQQYYWKGMNKDIWKYIANCSLCCRKRAKAQSYEMQMTEITDRPFGKIAINLVTECETSSSGNRHILIIIDHLTGWLEAFPIPDTSADTIVLAFINHYLPVHMCSRYILLDNCNEFKNQLMDQVLQQLNINHIFSAPYHPQSNGKLEVFHKYLKPTLKKLCEKDLSNWDKYINKVLASYPVTLNLATAEAPFFLVSGRDLDLPLHQILEPMQCLLGDPESGRLNLETH